MESPSVGRSTSSLVVEEGLHGETLVAVLLAFIDGYPPHVRINAALAEGARQATLLEWAYAQIAGGERFAILCAEEFEEVCRVSAQEA